MSGCGRRWPDCRRGSEAALGALESFWGVRPSSSPGALLGEEQCVRSAKAGLQAESVGETHACPLR